MNNAEILHFFHKLEALESLKKVVVYHPEWNDVDTPRVLDDSLISPIITAAVVTYMGGSYGTLAAL